MLSGEPYPVKGAWLQTQNPLPNMSADPQKMYQALSKLDFIAVADLFMTPTIQAVADIVVPAASWVERDSLRAVWYNLGAINKIVDIGEAKGDYEIQLELGKRFNPEAWPWDTEEDVVNAQLKPSGLTFKDLRENGPHYPEFQYRKYEKGLLAMDGSEGFNTPTGKVEFRSTMFEDWGYDPLPYYEEPKWSPISSPKLFEQYPLILATGARSWVYFHSENRQQPTNREIHPNPRVEINPETAKKYGIKEGDWVWVENPVGRCRMEAHLTPGIDPRVVSADHGWWFPEKDPKAPSFYGVWESNINQLVPMAPGDTGFGAPYKSVICKIYKAE